MLKLSTTAQNENIQVTFKNNLHVLVHPEMRLCV